MGGTETAFLVYTLFAYFLSFFFGSDLGVFLEACLTDLTDLTDLADLDFSYFFEILSIFFYIFANFFSNFAFFADGESFFLSAFLSSLSNDTFNYVAFTSLSLATIIPRNMATIIEYFINFFIILLSIQFI